MCVHCLKAFITPNSKIHYFKYNIFRILSIAILEIMSKLQCKNMSPSLPSISKSTEIKIMKISILVEAECNLNRAEKFCRLP